ncbi:MAG: glycosyl transferase [Acidiferrobacteraceae bacterium]|nr:glycosyl transferase [Acidiferrobacteraceae bacterium]
MISVEHTGIGTRHESRIKSIERWADDIFEKRLAFYRKNRFFYESDDAYLEFLVPPGQRVLELGCGTGRLLAKLNPSLGVGVDISGNMISVAKDNYPDLIFVNGDIESPETISGLLEHGPFDVIILDNTLSYVSDVQYFLENISQLMSRDTRIVNAYHSYYWHPITLLASKLNLVLPKPDITSLRIADVENFMKLAKLETVKKERRILCCYRLFGIGKIINRYIATLPIVRSFCVRNYLVARNKIDRDPSYIPSASIIIPCRNEKGNIESAITRLPEFPGSKEIIFVEGHSTDGTWDEIQRVMQLHQDETIRAIKQSYDGKGDAVREGFSLANGEILVILDGDLTVPPEDVIKFYWAIVDGEGEYINGSRLVYPVEKGAMQFLNQLANHLFARVFTYLLNQKFTDTLCGTKAISRNHYKLIEKNRAYFGEFDPFGDFDLIFGAAKMNLKFLEIPVAYASRNYGSTQISRFRHGALLFRMVLFAYRKLKAI